METMIDLAAIAFEWRPAAPPLQILAGTILLAALAVVAYVRTLRSRPGVGSLLLLMRLAVIAALALLLLGPSATPPEETSTERPRLMVLADTSASMLTADCQRRSRIEQLCQGWLGNDQLAALRAKYDLRLMGIDESVRTQIGRASCRERV